MTTTKECPTPPQSKEIQRLAAGSVVILWGLRAVKYNMQKRQELTPRHHCNTGKDPGGSRQRTHSACRSQIWRSRPSPWVATSQTRTRRSTCHSVGALLDGVCKAVQTGTPLDELEKEGWNPEEIQSAASRQEWTQLHRARASARPSPREVRCGRGWRRRAFSGVGLQYAQGATAGTP